MGNGWGGNMRRRWHGILQNLRAWWRRQELEPQRTQRHRGIGEAGHEHGVDDSSNLGSWGRACGNHRGERSAARAAAGAGTTGNGSQICAADLLRALGLHRDRSGDVCRPVFRLRDGTGRGKCDGTVPEWIHGGILAAANRAADFLLRSRDPARELGSRHAVSGGVDCAGDDLWDGGNTAGGVRCAMKTTSEPDSEKQIPPFGRNDNGRIGRNDDFRIGRNDKRDSWAPTCATAGAAVWAGMAVLARIGIARLGAIEFLFLFSPLVIVPMGMELAGLIGIRGWLDELARRLQPVGASLAVVAMWLPPGRKAGLAALGWLLICVLMAGAGFVELVQALSEDAGGGARATRFAMGIARVDLAVGGAWLVASRLGMRPMGIQEPIGLLTAVHFHFAGFATAIIAAATLRFAEASAPHKWLQRRVLMVAVLPVVVAAGFVISPVVKMGAAVLFSMSVAVLAIAVRAYGRKAHDATARILLQVAAGSIFMGMLLSGAYAVADYLGSDALTIPEMARTHGILNAVGFCLAGLLGWLVENHTHTAVTDERSFQTEVEREPVH